MGMARILQVGRGGGGGGGGSHLGYLPDCLCILFLLTDIINERGMGWRGGGGEGRPTNESGADKDRRRCL